MPRCSHSNVQQYTEICMDCGRNIYESDEEYLASLRQLKMERSREVVKAEIERLERELGIGRGRPTRNDDCGW